MNLQKWVVILTVNYLITEDQTNVVYSFTLWKIPACVSVKEWKKERQTDIFRKVFEG